MDVGAPGGHVSLSRPELAGRVADALATRSGGLVVVAPAGYGKSTLVAAALNEPRRPVARLECTAHDGDPGHLAASLLAAVQRALPGAPDHVAEAVARSRGAVDPLAVVQALLEELDALLVDPVALVIDDAEVLVSSPGAQRLVSELLRLDDPRVGVAVLSRRRLGLRPTTSRDTARIVELGPGDLAFTAGECHDYVVRSTGEAPTPDELDRLYAATEGWPLGVATIVHAGEWRRGDRIVRTPADLRALLREDVLDRVDGLDARTIAVSALPRILTPDVAGALGLPDGVVDQLVAHGLHLRRVEPDQDRFAYHPLLRQLLLELLATTVADDELATLHARAATALAAAGHPEEAIEHWLAAGDGAAAVATMAAEADTLAVTAPGLVRGWLQRLPEAVRTTTPARLVEGRVAWAAGDYGRAIPALQSPLGGDDTTIDAATRTWCRFLLLDCLIMEGRHDEAVDVGMAKDPDDAGAGLLAVATTMYTAHALASLGRFDEADELATAARPRADDSVIVPIDVVRRAYTDLPAGDLDRALDTAVRAHELVAHDDPLLLRFNVMAVIATILAEQGRHADALSWWRRQRADADRTLLTARSRTVQGLEALLLAQSGDVDEAEAVLASHEPTHAWPDVNAHVARALVAAARGDRPRVLAATRRARAHAEAAPPLYRVWTGLGLVPALARVGGLHRADAVVREVRGLVDATYPGPRGRYVRARTRILQAWLAAERHDDPRPGRALVVRALTEIGDAAPHLIRVEWPRLAPLLDDVLDGDDLDGDAVVQWLWDAFPDGAPLAALAQHPRAEVRHACLGPALASGNPTSTADVVAAATSPDHPDATAARLALTWLADHPPARRFRTLGGFAVRRGGWWIEEGDWARPVDVRLLRFLVVHGQEPVLEDVLFEVLWPELEPTRARRSLQVAASRIRQVLDHPGEGPSIVESTRGAYRLRLGASDTVDWVDFDDAAARALDGGRPDPVALEHARRLWSGEPLPRERYTDWAAPWRQRMLDRYASVLHALVRVHDARGDQGAVIDAARELVALDPLDEGAHRALMRALARVGRRGQALRQFLACRRALADQLGVEPSAPTSRLHARVLAGVGV